MTAATVARFTVADDNVSIRAASTEVKASGTALGAAPDTRRA